MSSTVLVTGAGGFIGNAVLARLEDEGLHVKALDVGPSPHDLPPNVEWIQGSVNDTDMLRRALSGVDYVIHLAFVMDIDGLQPLVSCETNLLGTIRLFDIALQCQVRRVIWASSVMVYGPRSFYPPGPVSERDEPMPRTPYGASKLALERFAQSYRKQGLETVGLRFTTVFGPKRTRLGAAGFSVTLFEQAARGEIHVDEIDRRANMLFIDDAVSACINCLHAEGPLSDVYNIGGFECSVGDLVRTIQTLVPISSVHTEPGGESPWPTEINIERAEKEIHYKPHYNIERACQVYLQHLNSHENQRRQS